MKKIFLIIWIIAFGYSSFAGTPPASVQKAFKQMFPVAKNVKWVKENASEWEAKFKNNGVKTSANFAPDGAWMETETWIPLEDLPGMIDKVIHSRYPKSTVTETDRIEKPNAGITYETVIKTGKRRVDHIYKADGFLVK